MKTILFLAFIFLTSEINCQNRHLTLGIKNSGICFGNPVRNNGIRFNIWDRNVENLNGINITGYSCSQITNGINFGIIACEDSIQNGISLSGLAVGGDKLNGIFISSIFVAARSKINGLGVSCIWTFADTMNGVFFSVLGGSSWSLTDSIDVINGISVGMAIGAECKKLNGLAIGISNNISCQNGLTIAFKNTAKELHGFQIGFWNIAENNKIFRRTPIINFNLRKMASH